jgi:hypothetical protein
MAAVEIVLFWLTHYKLGFRRDVQLEEVSIKLVVPKLCLIVKLRLVLFDR